MATSMATPIEIAFISAALSVDAALVATVTSIVNQAYAMGEDGLWLEGAARTTAAEIEALIAAGEIAVARFETAVVGVVCIQRLDQQTCKFGMLAAAPECRSLGVGRALIMFAERYGREQGCQVMQLEILTPKSWQHPVKEFLKSWYSRAGYSVIGKGCIQEAFPDLAPLLSTPCDFMIYHKSLLA